MQESVSVSVVSVASCISIKHRLRWGILHIYMIEQKQKLYLSLFYCTSRLLFQQDSFEWHACLRKMVRMAPDLIPNWAPREDSASKQSSVKCSLYTKRRTICCFLVSTGIDLVRLVFPTHVSTEGLLETWTELYDCYRLLYDCYRLLYDCYRLLYDCYRLLYDCCRLLYDCYRLLLYDCCMTARSIGTTSYNTVEQL